MACQCCQRYAPHPVEVVDGKAEPKPISAPCAGDAAIAEARKWALIWKERAQAAGWKPKPRAAVMVPPSKPPPSLPPEEKPEPAKDIDPDGELFTFRSVQEAAELFGQEHEVTKEVDRRFRQDPGRHLVAIRARAPRAIVKDPATLLSAEDIASHAEWCPGGKLCPICAPWVPEGRKLAACAGKRRHYVLVDSPMHDQLLERGCFHCGAFPR